jgi:peptide/nickel transport system permease protein
VSSIVPPGLVADGAPIHSRAGFVRQVLRERKAAVLGLAIVLFFVVLAVIAPLIAPYSTTTQSGPVFAPPSAKHWFGCDDGGIDLLSEIMVGGRASLTMAFAATLVSILIGGGVGILAGYFGGWADITLMRLADYLLVLPALAFAMVIADLWGPSRLHLILVIGILSWASTARILRAQVRSVRERVYIKRAKSIGAGSGRLIFRHILPQVGPLLMANTVLTMAVAIYLETSLAFLGLEEPTTITWGTILQHAFLRTAISAGAWWAIVPDGIAITLLIMGCFLLGQAIEDALNPRLRIVHVGIRRWRLRRLDGWGSEAI